MVARVHSLIVSVAVFASLMVAMSDPVMGAVQHGPTGSLLLSSRPIEQQVDAAVARSVRGKLATLPFGPSATVISPDELEDFPGSDNGGQQFDEQLNRVEIEVRAPRGLPEPPLQAQIPLGLAGLAWGIRHPAQAWRLILPVLAA
jgi:hypothetical protein